MQNWIWAPWITLTVIGLIVILLGLFKKESPKNDDESLKSVEHNVQIFLNEIDRQYKVLIKNLEDNNSSWEQKMRKLHQKIAEFEAYFHGLEKKNYLLENKIQQLEYQLELQKKVHKEVESVTHIKEHTVYQETSKLSPRPVVKNEKMISEQARVLAHAITESSLMEKDSSVQKDKEFKNTLNSLERRYHEIFQLNKFGIPANEIGKRLGMGLGEVELIIRLYDTEKE